MVYIIGSQGREGLLGLDGMGLEVEGFQRWEDNRIGKGHNGL